MNFDLDFITHHVPGERNAIMLDACAALGDGDAAVSDTRLVDVHVDTGLTADFLLRHLADRGPSRVRVCTLADKRARRILPLDLDYVAIEAPDAFLLGYGLDYAGRYRNLRGLWTADGGAIRLDGDRPGLFKVGENRLIGLALDGSPITGPLADKYVLTKQADSRGSWR